jgi:hypothetical protein
LIPERRQRVHKSPITATRVDGAHNSPDDRTCVFEFLRDFWGFLRVRKKYWLLPMLVVLGLLGILTVLAESSAAGPFIYTLF